MSALGRRAIAGVAVAVAVAGGAVIARADGTAVRAVAADGGLGVNPVLIEKPAGAGPVGTLTVANHGSKRLDVKVTPRPWVQSTSGAVSVNRSRTLSGVAVDAPSFALAAGAEKTVGVTASTGTSMFGGIEVTGLPAGTDSKSGVVAGYRLVTSLRLNPATAVLSLKAGSPKVTGSAGKRTLVLPVRNAGNTIMPVTGNVRLKGALGTRQRTLSSVRVLPGRTVNVLLGSGSSLSPGSYTATVELKQGGKTTTVTKKLTIKR